MLGGVKPVPPQGKHLLVLWLSPTLKSRADIMRATLSLSQLDQFLIILFQSPKELDRPEVSLSGKALA